MADIKNWKEGNVDKTSEDVYSRWHQPEALSIQTGIPIADTRKLYMSDIDKVWWYFDDTGTQQIVAFLDIKWTSRKTIEEYQSQYERDYHQNKANIYRILAHDVDAYYLIVYIYPEFDEDNLKKRKGEQPSETKEIHVESPEESWFRIRGS